MTKSHMLWLAVGVVGGFYLSLYIAQWTGISPAVPASLQSTAG